MIEDQISRLERSIVELSEGLISAENTSSFPPNEWNASEIAAHMLLVEIMFHRRIQRVSSGENPHFPYYLNTGWNLDAFELRASLAEWAAWRKRVVALVRALEPAQLKLTGRHDHFGTTTVADLLKIAADHDIEHIVDLKKHFG